MNWNDSLISIDLNRGGLLRSNGLADKQHLCTALCCMDAVDSNRAHSIHDNMYTKCDNNIEVSIYNIFWGVDAMLYIKILYYWSVM